MEQNYKNHIDLLLKHIEQADAICIGAAAGMSVATGYDSAYHSDYHFKKYFGQFEKKYGFKGSFNGYYYPYKTSEERWAFLSTSIYYNMTVPDGPAYEDLFELVKDKNYFVVTTNQDTLFHRRFPEEKVSTIQGDFLFFQCAQPCHDKIYESKALVEEMYATIDDCKIPTELIPHCPKCGKELEPWVRGYHFLEGSKYKEEYKKWHTFLEKNQNKKILFLELGVGRMTPMFIQEPFWNYTYQLPHAFYVTINPQDALLPQELENKGLAIKEDIALVLKHVLALRG